LINGILRGEWAFDGLVVSDWGGSRGRVQALKAGADLEMPECRISAAEVVAAVQCGELEESVLNKSVQRICQFAERADKIEAVPFDVDEHDKFAQKVAEESLVLLKNQDCALPLNNSERIAVIGDFAKTPRYQGAGSSQIIPTSLSNILGVIGQSGLNFVGFARGFERFGGENKKLLKAALKLVERCDTAIVCIGLDEDKECEGLDRSNLRIDDNQVELLEALAKTGKKIVAVLSCGSAVETDWDCNVNALLLAHLSGQSGARAVINALTGKINPSGKLAESYPVKLADVPCFEIYSESPYKSDYAEGIYVGYRYYNTFDIPVKYPFGYGLSYTQFAYSDFKVDDGGVCVTVTNSGERDGAEVVQVYVKAPRPDMPASPSELKLFTKIFLRAGESKQVHLPYDEYTFRTWNSKTHRFEAGGVYEISVNADSLRKLFTARYEVTPDNLPEGCAFAEMREQSEITFKEYFESRLTPDEPHEVSEKLVANLDMQVADLIYCKGLVAKLFGTIAKMYKKSEDKLMATAFDWLRVRSLLQFMNLTSVQAEGFILACNGHFFKGMRKLLSKKY
nr:glycoside hydrolase family 3 C-terminal domain-containing protein [Clostridia bacterium]